MNSIDLSERFTAHFALREFLKSDTAEKHGIPNVPLKCHIMRLRNLAVRCLEPTRQRFGLPLLVTSGYRCPRLNELVGGVHNSQHMTGEAADIQVPRKYWPFCVTTQEQMALILWDWMRVCLPDYDQLIVEHSGATWWVHVSCRIDLTKNRRKAFKLTKG
ncbi:MAG: peptidase M15 [Prevotella sp.]|nr:peptidase M15 [Prevotella sp.]